MKTKKTPKRNKKTLWRFRKKAEAIWNDWADLLGTLLAFKVMEKRLENDYRKIWEKIHANAEEQDKPN